VGQRRDMGMQYKARGMQGQGELQAQMQQKSKYLLVPLEGQQQPQPMQQQRMGVQGMQVQMDLDGGEMPIPFNDDNSFPVLPGSNIDMFRHYEPASPRDNPCARNSVYVCDSESGRCGCMGQGGNAQLGFIGGAGVEGGQGNSDSIYGSHDDHSTYGVSGTGWQGPGNGEAPGQLPPSLLSHPLSVGQKRWN
jgi:hypothetical protein